VRAPREEGAHRSARARASGKAKFAHECGPAARARLHAGRRSTWRSVLDGAAKEFQRHHAFLHDAIDASRGV